MKNAGAKKNNENMKDPQGVGAFGRTRGEGERQRWYCLVGLENNGQSRGVHVLGRTHGKWYYLLSVHSAFISCSEFCCPICSVCSSFPLFLLWPFCFPYLTFLSSHNGCFIRFVIFLDLSIDMCVSRSLSPAVRQPLSPDPPNLRSFPC